MVVHAGNCAGNCVYLSTPEFRKYFCVEKRFQESLQNFNQPQKHQTSTINLNLKLNSNSLASFQAGQICSLVLDSGDLLF